MTAHTNPCRLKTRVSVGSGDPDAPITVMNMNRKNIRLSKYDYSSNGYYFVTICTKDRQCIFSSVGSGDLDAPILLLTKYGQMVDKNIRKMNEIYTGIQFTHYVIMPNHLHLLICIQNEKQGASRSPLPTNGLLSQHIGTLKRFCNKEIGVSVWQTSFYDHIIRNEEDLYYHLQYIEENPQKWLMGKDEYYA